MHSVLVNLVWEYNIQEFYVYKDYPLTGILSEYINKPWIKATLKEIKNLTNNQTFLVEDPDKY